MTTPTKEEIQLAIEGISVLNPYSQDLRRARQILRAYAATLEPVNAVEARVAANSYNKAEHAGYAHIHCIRAAIESFLAGRAK